MSRTIFHPGKALTTSWLNSSQYIGPSNPGVVFVSNPTEDWQYPLLKTTSLDLPNFSQYFVATTGNQSIDGIKSFTSIPTFPTSTAITGNDGVNITRLTTDLETTRASIVDEISTIASDNTAAISVLSTNLNTNFVTLAGGQTITGAKTFDNILVPNTPVVGSSPISLQHYTANTVLTNGDQSIQGTKYFENLTIPLTPALPENPVSLQFFNDTAVLDTGNQTIAGIKTFLDPRVPLVPLNTASPISLDYFNTNVAAAGANAVLTSGDQTIDGIKTFLDSPVVPTATANSQAVNLGQLTSLIPVIPVANVAVAGNKITLPDNVVITWGFAGGNGVTNASVSYGHSYSTSPIIVIGTLGTATGGQPVASEVSQTSSSSFLFSTNTGAQGIYWIAIGR